MGTGDYICVTLRGGAPWGFTLREGEGDTYRPLLISQVEEGGCAFLAGVWEGDEVVSLNGEPCADLTLLRAFALIDTSIDCLQLLLKRHCSNLPGDCESEEVKSDEREPPSDTFKSTTLHIFSPKHRAQSPRELYISGPQDKAQYAELGSETQFPKSPHLLYSQLHAPSSDDQRCQELVFEEKEVQKSCPPGDMVELQVSLSEQTLIDRASTSLGSARGIEGEPSNREAVQTIHTTTVSHCVPCPVREPLGQHGVVLSSPSVLEQVEVILQQQSASGAGRGILSVGGPGVSGSVGSQSKGEEGGEHSKGFPGSFTVSFGIPSEEVTQTEDQNSDSEGDPDRPNKHRARHARLRRSESLSEKQVKEAKSKCKRIALLLTAAPPNPNNKGVLMFKKHRQRAKKYTLVSYGTGEDEPEHSDEEDEENEEDKRETHTVEFTLVAPSDSEIDKHFLANAHSGQGVLTVNWDKGLLEIERNLNNQVEMECLPETQGKGALMFAQRRQRMEEISAEHEELRRQGIPVEGLLETEKKAVENSYMQSTTEGQVYMDVNVNQQSQQQCQQYQEQQYYEQQSYQQQQQAYQQQQQTYQQQQQYQQQYQQQQYEQHQYQQQQRYQQQQQEYHQQQQQMQYHSSNVNGTVQHQTNEMQSSFSNRTAKPFSVENMAATPYSPTMSGTNQESMGQGEQIASRDERISTPAIRSGLLMDARRRNIAKPMFTFREAPKVSPNPALLHLLNRSDKKLGFETAPEEDYLSLGAEACNFLQSPRVKHKTPPPVAPKPVINPNTAPWSAQIELTNPDMAQHAENSVSTPAVAPTTETAPAPGLEPTPAPASEHSPPPAPQEPPASNMTEEQHTWTLPKPEHQQQPQQVMAQADDSHMNSTIQPESAPVPAPAPAAAPVHVPAPPPVPVPAPAPAAAPVHVPAPAPLPVPAHAPARTWDEAQSQQPSTNSWHPAQVQPQKPSPSQSPQQPWVAHQTSQSQAQPQSPQNTWTPRIQPTWGQLQGQAETQAHVQPHWSQPLEQQQPPPQATWTQSHEQPQHLQPTWGQPQELMQQQAKAPWTQPPQRETQPQPPWVQPPQEKPQAQPPWVQRVQPESQPQPAWVQQPQQEAPQQAWSQPETPGQPQPPWVSSQPQQQQQPSVNAWAPSQAQVQPPWMEASQAQSQTQPQPNLNPWAPVPPQTQSQPPWAQQSAEHNQHVMNLWAQEQNEAQPQPPWAQPVPLQSAQQPHWQSATSKTSPQPPMSTWAPAQTQPQPPVNAWTPESQQTPISASISMVNNHPPPKPWQPQNAPQSRTQPPPPQRIHSFTIGQRSSPPINPMATVLNPSSAGSSYEMPAVKGKGADMFAKRQSRMEKYVVDSETVQANKASRSTSPAASLPTEWKYTPNSLGRSYSLSPPARVASRGHKSASPSSSPKPATRASTTPPPRQTSLLEKAHKPPTPWEAASRHPLGLVDEAFRNTHQTLASNIRLAAQRKILPEPPAGWKARVSYGAQQKTGSQTWSPSQSRSQSRGPLPSFLSPTKSAISPPALHTGYRSLPRQWQSQRSVTEANMGYSVSPSENERPSGKQTYKSVFTSNTWSWRQ
ncbi:synaptopodin-2 isoform X2 [Echeneis naucrates]|uniref:synaptopodin-2 isoform X2 n=1 Tax=Echeneis naucrates TaxID=173247 RepID=UPI00111427EA|nr:synaptopodin-2-like isoform X2 [Echeneis naucrates]